MPFRLLDIQFAFQYLVEPAWARYVLGWWEACKLPITVLTMTLTPQLVIILIWGNRPLEEPLVYIERQIKVVHLKHCWQGIVASAHYQICSRPLPLCNNSIHIRIHMKPHPHYQICSPPLPLCNNSIHQIDLACQEQVKSSQLSSNVGCTKKGKKHLVLLALPYLPHCIAECKIRTEIQDHLCSNA